MGTNFKTRRPISVNEQCKHLCDQNTNKHLNSSVSVKIIEDCFASWNIGLRNNTNSIVSISVVYWKEISVGKYKCVYPTIWFKENGCFYGTINYADTHFIGFVVKLRNENETSKL